MDTTAGRSSWPRRIVWSTIALIALTLLASAGAYHRLAERHGAEMAQADWLPIQNEMRFSDVWENDIRFASGIAIARTLVARKMRGCGSFSWAESEDFEHVYLVACNPGGDSGWSYSIVRTDTQRVYTVGLRWLPKRPLCEPHLIGRCAPDKPKNIRAEGKNP